MAQLTEREFSVTVGLFQGLDSAEIGNRLEISGRMVDYVIRDIKSKAGNPGMTLRSLVVRAHNDGILPEILGWRLSPSGQLVRSVQAATRESMGLSLPPK